MELVTLLTADYANVTQDGKVNVMGIFDRITSPQFPARHPEMVLVMKFVASPDEYDTPRKLNVKLINEDASETLIDWSRELIIPAPPSPGGRAEINQFLKLRDIIFPASGVYAFYVKVDNDNKGSISVILREKD